MQPGSEEGSRSSGSNAEVRVGSGSSAGSSAAPPKPPRQPTMGSSTRGVLESQLLSSLECPVCMEYMAPPIPLCENGHSVCGECGARCRDCPTCRRPLLKTRNLALEALARGLRYPCRHADEGCSERIAADDLLQHSRACAFRPLGCPLNWGRPEMGCTWRGPVAAMRPHLEACHPRRYSEFADPDASAVVWEISQAGCFRDYTHVVFAFGEAFVYHKRFNMRDRKLYFAVALASGARAGAPEFRYKYKTSRQAGRQCLSLSAAVHSMDDDVEATLLSGGTVAVDFDTLVAFGKGAQRLFSIRRERGHSQAPARKSQSLAGEPDGTTAGAGAGGTAAAGAGSRVAWVSTPADARRSEGRSPATFPRSRRSTSVDDKGARPRTRLPSATLLAPSDKHPAAGAGGGGGAGGVFHALMGKRGEDLL